MKANETKPGERYLRPEDLRRLQNFSLAAKQIVDGFYAGRHRSPRYDSSAEFADYRPYVPGDDIRGLDWRAAARTDRDYVKLFRKETDRRCLILLDSSASMAFRDEQGNTGNREQGTRRGANTQHLTPNAQNRCRCRNLSTAPI